ncbi:MAG: RHS repeat-associated core domain-containing protein [Candidatus Methylomirabilales bacterium]
MASKNPATGAYSLGPRLYDPGISRFVGADFFAGAAANLELALDPLTANRYLYAGANPANSIDDGDGPVEWLRKKLQPLIHAPRPNGRRQRWSSGRQVGSWTTRSCTSRGCHEQVRRALGQVGRVSESVGRGAGYGQG